MTDDASSNPPTSQPAPPNTALADRILAGDFRAGARLIRWLDDRRPGAEDNIRALYPHAGGAYRIGITGNPGSGKSTLTSRLVTLLRKQGRRVGVVAVDPSSPYTGGAILGDRIRMAEHTNDPDVFIRSLATRGTLGGLSQSTSDVVTVMDAMGFDPILIETVGVGQDEVEIVKTAHTNLVVLVPGMGDDIQAIKAGILEIADIFVVNKADLTGVDRVVTDLRQLQALMSAMPTWIPPITQTMAHSGDGVPALLEVVDGHRRHLESSGEISDRNHQQSRHSLEAIVVSRIAAHLDAVLADADTRQKYLDPLLTRERDPYSTADALLAHVARRMGQEPDSA